MKKEPTYYTPTLEDLSFGLEYEVHIPFDDRWQSAKINSRHSVEVFLDDINFNTLRVKQLDEDDILELGWTFYAKANGIKHYMLRKYMCMLNSKANSMVIYLPTDDTIYRGKCSNKTELKRLMNNLDIKNEKDKS